MGMATNLKIIHRLAFGSGDGATHAQRLENFYRDQAPGYDEFRRKLLPARDEFFQGVSECTGLWIDMGCGTGQSLEFMRRANAQHDRALLVDLCPSLLAIARRRIESQNHNAAEVRECDVRGVSLGDHKADLITFCYSLSMIPDWIDALEHALSLLRPGGTLAVIDFYVSRPRPDAGLVRHGWITRSLLPLWFAQDDVNLRSDLLPWLNSHLRDTRIREGLHRLPYVGFRAPYFIFVGKKPAAPHN